MDVFWMAYKNGQALPWTANSQGPISVWAVMNDRGSAWVAEQNAADIVFKRVKIEPIEDLYVSLVDVRDTPISVAEANGILASRGSGV